MASLKEKLARAEEVCVRVCVCVCVCACVCVVWVRTCVCVCVEFLYTLILFDLSLFNSRLEIHYLQRMLNYMHNWKRQRSR